MHCGMKISGNFLNTEIIGLYLEIFVNELRKTLLEL